MKYFDKIAISKDTIRRSIDLLHTKKNILSHLSIKGSPVITLQKKHYSDKIQKMNQRLNEKSFLKTSEFTSPVQGIPLNVNTRQASRLYDAKILGRKRISRLVALWA